MSRKKAQLPFVIAPKREPIIATIGTESSGTFEIERKGYLTVAEKSFMQQAMSSDETMMTISRLAGKISRDRNVTTDEVIEVIGRGDFSNELLVGYETSINELVAMTNTLQDRKKVFAATCLLIFRLSREWQIEDTLDLHPDVLEGLHDLFLDEERKSLEAFEKKEGAKTQKGK